MSRNFELLQNLGREREMFEAQVESHTTLEEAGGGTAPSSCAGAS